MNQNDLKQIRDLVREELIANNKVIDVKLDNLEAKIDEKFETKMLKWKSDIMDAFDSIASEITDERDFREISSHQTSLNTSKIINLEKKVFGVVQSEV